MSVSSRFEEVFLASEEIPFDQASKFILFSDCHRGINDWADDFAPNQNIFFYALQYYFDHGFTYIELGDGDELWENNNFNEIQEAHSHVFWQMGKFRKERRLYLIWGNHNRKWKDPEYVQNNLWHYADERERKPGEDPPIESVFSKTEFHEGLILQNKNTNKKILLTHGHQGDLMNDRLWWVSRYIVKNIWKFLQLIGIHDPTSPAKNYKKRQRLEKAMIHWLSHNRDKLAGLIVGHTHKPYLPKANDEPYCNTGSCVHPRCITGIEIENNELSLVKWHVHVDLKDQGKLFIERELLKGPLSI